MLIFTMFANCNASDFKKIALCTNAAIKQIAHDKVCSCYIFTKIVLKIIMRCISLLTQIFDQYSYSKHVKITMEIFHPEYVGKKELQSKLRRSPFPAILITKNEDTP